MNAIALLEADHTTVKKLFKDWEKAKEADRADEKQRLAEEICRELTVHARIEEEIFYPALEAKADKEAEEQLAEAHVEHDQVKDLIAELELEEPGNEFDAKVKVMIEDVEHHVEEEENELFASAREKLGDQLDSLGARMEKRKQELLAEGVPAEKKKQLVGAARGR